MWQRGGPYLGDCWRPLRLRNVASGAEVSSSVLCKGLLSAEVRFSPVKKSALVSSDTRNAVSI